ncbi:ATP-binding protein [Streptomyces hebeiensis]
MREQLRRNGVSDSVVDDAVLILSELLSNACRHGRPLGRAEIGDGDIRAAWHVDKAGRLTVEVTDGGGPTRPTPSTPSVTARGGRGLNIITALAKEWGVRDSDTGEVTVWALVNEGRRHEDFATRVTGPSLSGLGSVDGLRGLDGIDGADALDGVGSVSGIREFGGLDSLEGLGFKDPFDGKG